MNFIIELFFNKHRDSTYDAYFVICDRYTKMTLYFSTTKIINSIELAELLFKKKISIWNFVRCDIKQKFNFHQRLLIDHLLSFENKTSIEYDVSFSNRWSNRTLKSNVKTFFSYLLQWQTNQLNCFIVIDWICLSKCCSKHIK